MATLYQVLDVPVDATGDDIKKAYRKLAKEKHPDVCADEGAEDKFKLIVEAYETLSDPAKRKTYDFALQSEEQGVSVPLFKRMWDAYYSAPFTSVHARAGEDIPITASYKVQELFHPQDRAFAITKKKRCKLCSGCGYQKSSAKVCSTCAGKQTTPVTVMGMGEVITMHDTCEACEGYGMVSRKPCTACKDGKQTTTEMVSVPLPIRPHQNKYTRLRGKGNEGYLAPDGDVWIEWKQDPSDPYRIQGDDLYVKVTIPFKLAVLGGSHTVKLPDGKEHTGKIWPSTSNGDLEAIPDAGLLNPKTNKRGMCYVEWQVQTPRGLEELTQVWKGAQA